MPKINRKTVKKIPFSNLRGSFIQEIKKTRKDANIISDKQINGLFWLKN